MPELPDLQVFSRNLEKALKGRKLDKLTITAKAKCTPAAASIRKQLTGKKLTAVYREGKELRFAFGKTLLGIHLMLHGKLVWDDEEPAKYRLVTLAFKGKPALILTDFQSQARIKLDPEESVAPDALDRKFTAAKLKELLQSTKQVKTLLMDQALVRGIGNAYADEILWDARISPLSVAAKIPAARIMALHRSIRKIFAHAEKQIMKADKDIIGGEIRDFMLIHNRTKKTSPGGSPIKKVSVGGRKSYYTDEQVLYK